MPPDVGCVRSSALGVSMRPEGAFFRVRDLRSGKAYHWTSAFPARLHEEVTARRQLEERAVREADAGRSAEARLATLEAEAKTAAEQRAAAAELETSRLKQLLAHAEPKHRRSS